MRLLGIDFGKKRVGLSISDENRRIAFPYAVLPNDSKLLLEIEKITVAYKITKIIIGESKNFDGMPNKIMGEILNFAESLKEKTKLSIIFEPEFMTSVQAEKIQGKNDLIDASASAIILQSYIDRLN